MYIYTQVGGDFYDTVLPLMNEFGRVSICGCISQYNLEEQQKGELRTLILMCTNICTIIYG